MIKRKMHTLIAFVQTMDWIIDAMIHFPVILGSEEDNLYADLVPSKLTCKLN